MAKRLLDPIHPGEILREEFMKPLGLNGNSLSLALRVPATRIGQILRGRRSITTDTALRLGRFFGTSPDLWLGLQTEYDLRVAQRQLSARIEKEVQPLGQVA